MTAETELYGTLSGHAGLVSLVDDSIFPDAIPEGKPLPAVVYLRSGTNPTHTIDGALVCEDVHFVITAWSETRGEAEAVADQIELALSAAGNPKVDRSSGYDNETGLFAVTVETDWFWSA